LLDVNFLVALLDQEHVRHGDSNRWLLANRASGWATCPLTENGSLRVMTNPRYAVPQSASFVLGSLEATKGSGNHAFWPDDISITDAAVFDCNRLQGHQQVTDIYLLALAVAHGGRLVTFDQRIRHQAVRRCGEEHLVTL
jgi:toxin-antitoxin system PIN domain toxin